MNAPTKFIPPAIASGVITLENGQYMTDTRGNLVPLALVKPQDKLQDEAVRKIMGHALALSAQLTRFKEHSLADLADLDALLDQEYGVTKRGNSGRGNRSYISHDGLLRIQIAMADSIDFGPELQVAKTLVDECLNEWAAGARPEIRAIVTRAFNTDKTGQINRSEIFMLLRLDISDERWKRAMDAIRDAMRVIGRKEYVRFATRPNINAEFVTIPLNLAAVE